MSGVDGSSDRRNPIIAGATTAALVGNGVKGFALDRGRALTALPHVREHGLQKKFWTQFMFGRFTHDVVPISGGTVSFRGTVRTTNGYHHAYRWSNGLGAGLIAASMVYGVPNLLDAMSSDDGRSLMESRVGRTGVFGTVANAAGAAALVTAFAKAGPGSGRVLRTLQQPVLAGGPAVAILSALSIPVVANEFGLLDRFNRP